MLRYFGLSFFLIFFIGCSSKDDRVVKKEYVLPAHIYNKMNNSYKSNSQLRQPGMIKITRKTDNYSIDMLVDATDDNVYFTMELDKFSSNKRSSKNSLNDEDNQELFIDKNISSEDINQASKHILYSQTDFFEQNYDRALGEVEQAIKLNPKNAVAYALRGSIYYKMEKTSLARRSWKTALKIDPTIENISNMLDKTK